MNALAQPLALTRRRLAATPGFTILAVLMVGVGIGAATTMFSVIDGALLKPLPVAEPDRLVRLWESQPARGWEFFSVAEANFLDWRARSRAFSALGAFTDRSVNLTGGNGPERLRAAKVSAGFLPLFGVAPLGGRLFRENEDHPSSEGRVVLLSPGLWQRRFASDPKVLGTSLTIDGAPYEVVGVAAMPLRELAADLILPLRANPDAEREDHELVVIGRLRQGVTPAEAQKELESIAGELAREHPETNRGWGVRTMSLLDSLVGESTRRAFAVLAGGVACLLLVACANLASLLLARSAGRAQELALRAALGAGRGRLISHQLCEALMVCALGGGLGLLLAMWGLDVLKSLDRGSIPRLEEVGINGRAFAFALALALLTGLLSGLLPAWQATGVSPRRALQEGSTTILGGRRERRAQAVLVVAEVALSLVLLVGAGLLLRSYSELQHVAVGLELEDRLVLGLSIPEGRYPAATDTAELYRRLLERLSALPGVTSAAGVSALPFGTFNTVMDFELPGRPESGEGPPRSAAWRLVTPDYFKTLGIPLLAGRPFTDTDTINSPDVAIISQRLAELHFPGENPLGRRIGSSATIVGVVGDVRERGLELAPAPMIYFAYYQARWSNMPLILHTRVPVAQIVPAVRAALAGLDRDLPIAEVQPLAELLRGNLAPRRFHLTLLTAFAAVALLLAVGGLYGLLAAAVVARRREIGIRVALGAEAGSVVGMVMRWGLGLTAIGLALGLGAAAALAGALSSLLFGIRPLDAPTFLGVALLLLSVTAAAASLPALTASRVDPRETLRAS